MQVVKIGGNDLDQPAFLSGLAAAIAGLGPVVVVHGGGRGTSHLMSRLRLPVRFEQGLRVTDDETLAAAVMGLVGTASTQIVRALVAAGLPALGLSGVDAGLIRVAPLDPALGWVGTPVAVEAGALERLCGAGFIPCVASIALGLDGRLYNVNADDAAAAVAAAVGARRLTYVSNVPGLRAGGETLVSVTRSQADALIAGGDVRDGMIPKLRSALLAREQGVAEVVLTDLEGLRAGRGGTRVETDLIPLQGSLS